jgi:hypothetical protein
MNEDTSPVKTGGRKSSLLMALLVLLLVLGGALAVLCHQGFLPHRIHWANDMPLGAMLDSSARLPGTLFGHWGYLEWLGSPVPSSSPAFSILLQMLFPPEIYLKIFLPFSMFFLGFGAWLFFRESGFAPGVCIVGGLAAGLNMHYFSNGCWGLGTWAVSAAMVFIALAVIVSPAIRPAWVKAALAGLAVGMVVMEGFDSGAILTLYVGVFIVFYFLTTAASPKQGMPRAIGMGTLIVLFAFLISGSTLYTLVGTQIKGSANIGENARDKRDHWNFITMYSFPKVETLRLVIPGLFGYRLDQYITDTNKASAYWGSISEDYHVYELESGNAETRAQSAASLGLPVDAQNIMAGRDLAARESIVNQIKPSLPRRHTGSGDYVGILVCLLAGFGLFNTWRKVNSPYSKPEREAVWFWSVAALISLLAAWGRYAPFYQLIYHLPFINNIRNPIKFLHALNICLIILAGYGLESLYRRYMKTAPKRSGGWWESASTFDRKWIIGTLLVLGAGILGALVMESSKSDLVNYLGKAGFDPDLAPQIAGFSIKEVVLFLVFFGVSAAGVAVILSGAWSGKRAVYGWIFLGVVMIWDLGRADKPWVRYYDYQQKYTMNSVVDYLRHDPWEHRVVSRLSPIGGYDLALDQNNLAGICHWWLENDYMANNIESLEIDQAPRMPDIDRNYINNFTVRSQQDLSPAARLWRLTNTRYLLADARVVDALNQLASPKNSFRAVMLMDIIPKPNIDRVEDAGDLTVQTNNTGHVALIEFTQALPRAKLYADWQTVDDAATLAKLNSDAFDPARTVLVAGDTPVAQKLVQPGAEPGTVTITDYKPKDVKLKADAKTAAVLLLNDRTGDYWGVWVDGKPAPILRCNYIMRGVYLPAGPHTVEFRFQAPLQWLYVSSAMFGVGILLAGCAAVARFRRRSDYSN